jgi:hypothetical protein
MKKAVILLSFALWIPILFNSCKKEDVDARDKFVGSWSMSETLTVIGIGTGTQTYTMTITKSSAVSDGILMNSLGDIGYTIKATVNGSSITISDSFNDAGDIYSVSGSGNITDNTLKINYNIGGFWNATGTGTKL